MPERRVAIARALGGVPGGGQQLDDAVAMHAALLEHPVVVEVAQQLAVGQCERFLEPPLSGKPAGLA